MNYLAELIDHLDGDELARLRELTLTAREREVLEYLITNPTTNRKSALAGLAMTGSHFDKLSSTLLSRCYDHFAPDGIINLFDFLKLKGLWAHLEHEYKKEEKRLVDTSDREAFYFLTLRHLALYTYEKRYVELLERCMTSYLSLNDSSAAQAIVNAIQLQITAHTSYSMGIEAARDEAMAAVFAHRSAAEASKDVIAMHYQLNAEAHCALLDNEGSEAAERLVAALDHLEAHTEAFLPSDRARVLAQLAEALYYDDKLDDAYARYQDLFTSAAIDIPPPHYHAVKFAQIMIAFERFEDAEQLLRRWYPRSSFKSNDRRSSAGAVNFAKLYLTWGKLDEAKEFIDLGFAANVKAEIVTYEAQLRMLDLLRFFELRQFDFANELMEKLIRYSREKNVIVSAASLPPFFAAMKLLIKSRCDLDPDLTEFDRLTTDAMPSQNRHVAVMLQKVRDRTPIKK